MHYSESRDGLNGRCSFSAVRGKRVHSWTVSSTTKAVKLNRFHLFFTCTVFSRINAGAFILKSEILGGRSFEGGRLFQNFIFQFDILIWYCTNLKEKNGLFINKIVSNNFNKSN